MARVGIGSGRPGLIILALSVGAARNLAAIATHIPYFPFIHFPEGKQADGLESILRLRDARVVKCTQMLALLPLNAWMLHLITLYRHVSRHAIARIILVRSLGIPISRCIAALAGFLVAV